MRIKIDRDPMALEQNNSLSKIANVYIVYDLDAWVRNSTDNSNLRVAYLEQLV